nr:mechanosensitive ion channel family protein [Acaryochloris sp. CCMEE 5410]
MGLGSVAIGFAFQDIIKNLFAGILLLLQEPFSINDQIIIDSFEGTVEKINFRTTQIRTYQGERILIPNANVFTSAVQVQTAYPSRRTDLGVGVDYNTPLEDAASLLQGTIEQLDGVLSNPAPEIDLVGFGDSSIDFIVRYWTEPQQAKVRRVQTKAIIAIKKAFDKADITIPYPIRTLYYYNQDNYNDYMPTSNNHQDSRMLSKMAQ